MIITLILLKDLAIEKPTSVAKQSYLTDDIKIVDHVISHYEHHPSVRHIKKNLKFPKTLLVLC